MNKIKMDKNYKQLSDSIIKFISKCKDCKEVIVEDKFLYEGTLIVVYKFK